MVLGRRTESGGVESGVGRAAEVERFARAGGDDGIIAEVRIAMDHPVPVKRHIPGPKQCLGDLVALFLRRILCRPGDWQQIGKPLALLSDTPEEELPEGGEGVGRVFPVAFEIA